jgi:kinetochore protein Mis13/DSN1
VGDNRVAGSSSRQRANIGTGLGNEEMEAELERRIPDVAFKIDHLYSLASTARTTVDVLERTLDQRFNLLSLHLAARSKIPPPIHDPGSGSGAQILSRYVKRDVGTGPDAMDVMRALARVDRERPPAMVGDAARRAAREVQRAGESGVGAVGERRLTGVPPSSGMTPRKVPGTPRRGGTPSRERER